MTEPTPKLPKHIKRASKTASGQDRGTPKVPSSQKKAPAPSEEKNPIWTNPKLLFGIAVVGLILTFLQVAFGLPELVERIFPDPPPPSLSYLFVVDTSAEMALEVNGMSRLEVAEIAIRQIADAPLNTSSVWRGLRVMGGGDQCNQSSLISSGRDLNVDNFISGLEGSTPEGVNAHEEGIRASIKDFETSEVIQSDLKIVFIILGSLDLTPCDDFDFGVALASYKVLNIDATVCVFSLGQDQATSQTFSEEMAKNGFDCVHSVETPQEISNIAINEIKGLISGEVNELDFFGNSITSNTQWIPVVKHFGGIPMVLVPAGCFMMGTEDNQEGYGNEQPVHEQCFDAPFWIDQYEATNALYGGPSDSPYCNADSSAPDQPRNCVTWFEALAYCQSRGPEFSLPSEREWEYAARGPDNWIYPWGNDFVNDRAYVIWDGNSNGRTAAIGGREAGASWVGAQDMAGNLWEWTISLYAAYPYDKDDGRENLEDTTNSRVLRSGSFLDATFGLRLADRNVSIPSLINYDQGFRCFRSY